MHNILPQTEEMLVCGCLLVWKSQIALMVYPLVFQVQIMTGPSPKRVVVKHKVNSMVFNMKKIQNQVGREVRVQKVDMRRVEG